MGKERVGGMRSADPKAKPCSRKDGWNSVVGPVFILFSFERHWVTNGEVLMKSLQRLFWVALALVVAAPAFAQAPPAAPPTRIRGTVESLDGNMLMINSREGQMMHVALAPNSTVRGVAKRSLSDIKAGDYVASTSIKGTDGKLHA